MLRHFFHLGRAYFELDHRQAKAYLWLLFFTAILTCSPLFTYYLYPTPYDADDIALILETKGVDLVAQDQSKKSVALFKKRIDVMTERDWITAGLPVYLSKRILKYQSKVKPLQQIKDLYAIYGIDSSHVAQVKPYLVECEVLEQRYAKEKYRKQKPLLSVVDINTADSAALEALPAIGPVLSKRILKYRELLKGYVSKKQYTEIYGINPEALAALQKWTEIKSIPVVGNIRTVDYQLLNGHFYLSGKDARFILTQLKTKALCWTELQYGLESKAQAHIEELELYYPCE